MQPRLPVGLGAPGDAALSMVNSAYVEWRAQLLTPSLSFGAMPSMSVPSDFDDLAASEITQMFLDD